MKVYINITEAASEDTLKAFKAAFFYLNKGHQYSFIKEKDTDITINLTTQFFPLKSLDNYLNTYKDKELTLTEDSPLVFKGSVYIEKPQDKHFIWFPEPIDNLLDIVEINKDNASYLSNLAYVYMFGFIANSNQEYLNKCERILKLIYPNIFSNYKLVFSGIELVTAKAYGIQLIYDKLGVLAKPSNRSLINKNICFACVTSIEYTEPTYVFLHSMFAFNDIKVFKVYYVNGTKKAVKELQEILGISRPTVYNLLKKNEFRWVQLDGGKYRISKKSFDDWLDKLPQELEFILMKNDTIKEVIVTKNIVKLLILAIIISYKLIMVYIFIFFK